MVLRKYLERRGKVPADDQAEALALELGPTASGEIRKRAARLVLPDTDEAVMDAIDADIAASPTQTLQDRRLASIEALTQRLAQDVATEEADDEDDTDDDMTDEDNGNDAQ